MITILSTVWLGGPDLRLQVGVQHRLELVELCFDEVLGAGALVERVGLRQQVALEVVGAAGHLRALDDEVVGLPVGRVGGVDVVLRLAVARRLPLGGSAADRVALGDREADLVGAGVLEGVGDLLQGHLLVERVVARLEAGGEVVQPHVDQPDLAAADQALRVQVVPDLGARLPLADLERDLLRLVGGGLLGLVRVPAVG